MGVLEREQKVMKRFEEEGSAVEEEKSPIPLVIRNPAPPCASTPAPPPVVRLPGYRPPPPLGDLHNPIIIVESDSEASSSNYEMAPESRHSTPEEQKKQRRRRRIEWAFE